MYITPQGPLLYPTDPYISAITLGVEPVLYMVIYGIILQVGMISSNATWQLGI